MAWLIKCSLSEEASPLPHFWWNPEKCGEDGESGAETLKFMSHTKCSKAAATLTGNQELGDFQFRFSKIRSRCSHAQHIEHTEHMLRTTRAKKLLYSVIVNIQLSTTNLHNTFFWWKASCTMENLVIRKLGSKKKIIPKTLSCITGYFWWLRELFENKETFHKASKIQKI